MFAQGSSIVLLLIAASGPGESGATTSATIPASEVAAIDGVSLALDQSERWLHPTHGDWAAIRGQEATR
jgi:hypothetical protein